MATVPGPNPDGPLPTPAAPAAEPYHEPASEPDEERTAAPGPDSRPDRQDQPWSPDRERIETDAPAAVP